MQKLKKYNQIIFALLGTCCLLILSFGGIMFLINEFKTPTYVENTLIAKEELDSLKNLNLRNQIIAIEEIYPLDTLTSTYIIPVFHKKLQDPSYRNENIYGLLNIQSEYSSDFSLYGYGNYNNFVLYNFNTTESRILFNERINIDNYQSYKSTTKNIIVFTGWSEDTNNDGKLGNDDFEELYIYDLLNEELKKVQNTKYKIESYDYLPHVERLIFTVTDLKSERERKVKPEFLVYYSEEENKLKPLVKMSVLNRLQEIIDN